LFGGMTAGPEGRSEAAERIIGIGDGVDNGFHMASSFCLAESAFDFADQIFCSLGIVPQDQ
jgi:hypothetical protein